MVVLIHHVVTYILDSKIDVPVAVKMFNTKEIQLFESLSLDKFPSYLPVKDILFSYSSKDQKL